MAMTNNVGRVSHWFRAKVGRIEHGAEGVLREVTDEGAALMRENIATRGTAKSGREGRIDTGLMYDSVNTSVTTSERGNVTGRFGWIGRKEKYFPMQELGFTHYLSGEAVEPMYALADASEYVFEKYRDELRKVARGA